MYIPDGETLTVAQALANAGGSDDDGDKKNVGVIHHTVLKNGAVKSTLVVVNVQDLMKNQNNVTDVALQPGDYLIVPTRKKGHSIGEYLSGVSQAAYGVLGIRAL
jgi:protein involved in polysaccharide export with SLBB domain